MKVRLLTPSEARPRLLAAARLGGVESVGDALVELGCVQLDPIDRVGRSQDLVLHARVPGYRRDGWIGVGSAFEHFAKERCLLPAWLFPWYRERSREQPWWRATERMKRLSPELLSAVLGEVRERGVVSARELSDHGRVKPLDWNGWKGTSSAAKLALETLWQRCEVVVCDRDPRGQHRYCVPEVGLPAFWDAPAPSDDEVLLERVRQAGWLPLASGPWWGQLRWMRERTEALVASGRLVAVRVTGSRRTWVVLAEQLDQVWEPDGRMRVIAPLDPLIWDRKLIELAFGFEYLWEIYKPAEKRRWGYYVCPLLHQGGFSGRIEGRRTEGGIELIGRWGTPDAAALDAALASLWAMQAKDPRPGSDGSP